MTRFEKEMRKRFPGISFDADMYGNKEAFCVSEDALVVFCSPGLVEVIQFLQNGKERDVSTEYPRLSAPYLVYLCGGDEEHAKRILRSQKF